MVIFTPYPSFFSREGILRTFLLPFAGGHGIFSVVVPARKNKVIVLKYCMAALPCMTFPVHLTRPDSCITFGSKK
jgi:hypothetical protein